jgi:hypothetical protein
LNQMQKQEEKMKQEKLDEEFAKALQDENSFASMVAGPSSRPPPSRAPSAFDRMVGMRPQKPSSHLSHSSYSPVSESQRCPTSSPILGVESTNYGLQNYYPTSPSSVGMGRPKPERVPYNFAEIEAYETKSKNKSSKVKSEPGSFVNDSSSDSDIEVIDATEFNDNGRYSHLSTSSRNPFGTPNKAAKRPSFTPESQNAGEAALRRKEQGNSKEALHSVLFGNKQQHGWLNGAPQGGSLHSMNRPSSAGSLPSMNSPGNVYTQPFGPGIYMNPGMGIGLQGPGQNPFMNPNAAHLNGSGNVGFNGIGSMPGSFPGGNMQAPGNHLGYTVNNIPSYGEYNPNQQAPGLQGSQSPVTFADLIRRNGMQNLDAMTDFLGRPLDAAMQGQVDYIMNDPRKTNEEIKALLENIRPDLDLPAEDREGTPNCLKYPLVSTTDITRLLILTGT